MNPDGELRMHFIKTLSLQNSEIRYSLIFSNRKHNLHVIIYWYIFFTLEPRINLLQFWCCLLINAKDFKKIIRGKRMFSRGRNCVENQYIFFPIYVKGDTTSFFFFFLLCLTAVLILLNCIQIVTRMLL